MKKTLATLSCALLAAIGLHAQNTALQFDGRDDFAQIAAPEINFNPHEFTFEAQIRPGRLTGAPMPLLLNENAGSYLLYGLSSNGHLYIETNGQHVEEAAYGPITGEECTWIAFVVQDEHVHFYINGQLTDVQPFANNHNVLSDNWYVGTAFPIGIENFYDGQLDELRFWTLARSNADIQNHMFPLVVLPNAGTEFYFPFLISAMTNQVSDDYFDPNNVIMRGNTMAIDLSDPNWNENECLSEYNDGSMSFKWGSLATGLANCTPTPWPEHLCNGNFEQYDPILNTTFTNNFNFDNAYALIPGTGAFTSQSDIVNWHSFEPVIGYAHHAYVNVNGGLGGTALFMTNLNMNYFNGTGYTFNWPIVNSDVLIALKTYKWNVSTPVTYTSGVKTEIATQMSNQYNAYELSFKYLVANWWTLYNISQDQQIRFILKGNGVPDVIIGGGTQILPLFNAQSPQGWATQVYNFTTPVNATAYTHLEIVTIMPQVTGNLHQVIWLDDVSLKPACQGNQFPQSISLAPKTGTLNPGTYTDLKSGSQFTLSAPFPYVKENHHHSERIVETDAQGNTYVAAYVNYDDGNYFVQNQHEPQITYSSTPNQVRQLNGWSGILLSKYNTCGELEWQETIFNKNHTNLAGMAVSPSGNIYVLGHAEAHSPVPLWQFLQTSNANTQIGANTPGKRVFVAEFNTNGTCTDIKEAAVSNDRHAVDIELHNGSYRVITNNGATGNVDVMIKSTTFLTTQFSITNRTALKSTVNATGQLYIATASVNAIDIKRVNFTTGATISTSPFITQNPNRPSFGFPTQTINDLLCDNNGNLFVAGNFTNGLSFIGGTPTNTFTSVYQNYANTDVGITGFVAKYTAGLGYLKSDFLAPQILPAQMVQIIDPNNPPSFSCTPPAAGACDVVTTFNNPNCAPGGIGYACVNLIWANQGPYTNAGFFGSIYQNLSIDANNNILISGIVANANWATGQLVQTNGQPFVCKYNNNLNRIWFNEAQGAVGIENQISGHTTSIAYEPFNGQHRVVGNFRGTVKLFDNTTLNMAGNHEHIFVTNVVDNGSSAVFKNDGDITSDDVEMATFKVYPNPANSLVTLTSPTAGFEYTIYNSFGQLLQAGTAESSIKELNVANLSAGIYILTLTGGKTETIRLVITK